MFIVLVEDDHFYATLLQEFLRQNGYTDLKHFDNGLECLLQVYEEKAPDVIIMDYQIGLINGVEILQKIRAYKPDLQVIFMSGQKDVKVAVQSMKKGARDYIPKDEKALERLLKVLKEMESEGRKKQENRRAGSVLSKVKKFLTDHE
ncbi:MAG: response regulator [Bacteroidales bacterium]|nr:response regulator [Bacteroidales bacterium]HNW73945.1 response regulator [Bacteroidales bacterium]